MQAPPKEAVTVQGRGAEPPHPMARIDSLGEPWQHPIPDKKKAGRREKTQAREFSHLVDAAAEDGELTR